MTSMNLHVRDVPEDVHRRLSRRAKAKGMSLRQYIIQVLIDDAELPSVEEWLDETARLPRTKLRSSGAQAVRLSRAADDAEVSRGRPRR